MVRNPYIIIQARINSERLPGKVLKKINGKPLISILIERLKWSGLPILVATSINKENDLLEEEVLKHDGVIVYRGSEDNVLQRFYEAAKGVGADPVFRLTGDNPLMDGSLLNQMLEKYYSFNSSDIFMSIGLSKSYPLGISAELFSFRLLEKAFLNATSHAELEHVTPYMYQNRSQKIKIIPFRGKMLKYHYRLTVDTAEDFELHEKLINLYNADQLSIEAIIKILDNHKELLAINRNVIQKTINNESL